MSKLRASGMPCPAKSEDEHGLRRKMLKYVLTTRCFRRFDLGDSVNS